MKFEVFHFMIVLVALKLLTLINIDSLVDSHGPATVVAIGPLR